MTNPSVHRPQPSLLCHVHSSLSHRAHAPCPRLVLRVRQGALELDPHDHELHYGFASAIEELGFKREARESYLAAERLYPLCPKPHLALGALLMGAGRTRAALRRFERALFLCPDPKDDDARTAAVNAGNCGLRLAKAHPSHAAALLPQAVRRLERALQGANEANRPAIEGLLRQASELASAVPV